MVADCYISHALSNAFNNTSALASRVQKMLESADKVLTGRARTNFERQILRSSIFYSQQQAAEASTEQNLTILGRTHESSFRTISCDQS